MRTFLLILLGAVIMYIILKILSSDVAPADSTQKLKALAATQQAANLIRTNEFRELVKTKEFINFASSLAEEQVIIMSKSLAG